MAQGGSSNSVDCHGALFVGGSGLNGRGVYINGNYYGPGLQINGGNNAVGCQINAGNSGGPGLAVDSPNSIGIQVTASTHGIYVHGGAIGLFAQGDTSGGLFLGGTYGMEFVGNTQPGLYVQSVGSDAALFYAGNTFSGMHIWGGQTSGDAFKLDTNGSGLVTVPARLVGTASIDLTQTGLSPRALDSVADANLTVGDALVCAIAAAAGKQSVVSTTYTIETPSDGTVIRTFTLDSATLPAARN
jgi:hypothetical protein